MVTCIRGRIPRGETVPEHTHNVNDILYPVSGKGKIRVEGIGDLDLMKGVLVLGPPGIRHHVYDVTEDLKILDIFSGPVL